jgi:hypothetical protein
MVMLIPEIAPYIEDNNNCNSHGKDIYLQMMEYMSYDGEYDADTNTFTYNPDAAQYTDSGDMYWICGHCDRVIEWVGDNPQVEVA